MDVFDISEEHIVGTPAEVDRAVPRQYIEEVAVQMGYIETDPNIVSDGVDVIYVVQTDEDRYLLRYMGFYNGAVVVTYDGLVELAENKLGDQDRIPNWVVKDRLNHRPDWIPDDYVNNSWVVCDGCDERKSVRDIVTPRDNPDEEPWICRECYRKGKAEFI